MYMALFKRKTNNESFNNIPLETLEISLQEISSEITTLDNRATELAQLRHADLVPDGPGEHGDYNDIMEGISFAKESRVATREKILARIDKINSGLAQRALDHLE